MFRTRRSPCAACVALFCAVLVRAASLGASPAQDHVYRYDSLDMQRTVNEMKAQHDYLELRVGSTLKTDGRLLTITAVHRDRVALLVEGTYRNLTKEPMAAGTAVLALNESPDRQMKWFKAHPATTDYHYGPGWNSHNEAQAPVGYADPGKTSTFVAVWRLEDNRVAAEPPAELVVLVSGWPE